MADKGMHTPAAHPQLEVRAEVIFFQDLICTSQQTTCQEFCTPRIWKAGETSTLFECYEAESKGVGLYKATSHPVQYLLLGLRTEGRQHREL
jgi:hypothetical protein